MILPILKYGHPLLKERAIPVKNDHPSLDRLIADMFETMQHAGGIGIAAPQINQSIRLFIIGERETDEPKKGKYKGTVFINPEIIQETGILSSKIEGCFSIPGIEVSIVRQTDLRIRYFSESFEEKEEDFAGWKARVIQHEYDHLEGILMTDRINRHRKASIKYFLKEIVLEENKKTYQIH